MKFTYEKTFSFNPPPTKEEDKKIESLLDNCISLRDFKDKENLLKSIKHALNG